MKLDEDIWYSDEELNHGDSEGSPLSLLYCAAIRNDIWITQGSLKVICVDRGAITDVHVHTVGY
jgi:hypothetical protein